MTGTPNQIEWAERIRTEVDNEFNRVSKAFQTIADRQSEEDRGDTLKILAILEEKRTEVLATEHAGIYIRDWGDLDGRVRRLLAEDPRFQTLKAAQNIRKRPIKL